ncbi:murein biosynthesis integral membrane protein MurJ [Patulibacter americanus]|uniref:murein biosynthesis integral membrane protein MurJ n=1 Tax=Patulibacter americanus TaxID=588672 RepID=UPI0003B5CC3C|nr:murein biosynthesis integral membrane protein MurJ [Patulibacter americanus]
MRETEDRLHAAVPADPSPVGGAAEGVLSENEDAGGAAGRARNTIIFSVATGFSRVAGLIREIFASFLYGASGAASAFTLAYAVPNLLRSLFADMALSAAFVPVFSELLEQKKRREALLLMSTLFWVLLGGLTILTAVAMVTAPLYMPLFVGEAVSDKLGSQADSLTVGLSQVMLPTVLLLGINGLFVGALNAYDHFTIPALSPLVWNVVIVVVNLALLPAFGGSGETDAIYAQAIGVLVGTAVQLGMAVPVLRRYGIRLVPKVNLQDPHLRQVLTLMVPVALSLGLINFSALIDSILASRVSDDGPRAIEAAFRLYMLPQGVFSVAIVTVLFPVLSRAVARGDRPGLRGLIGSGMGQILVLLVPIGMLFASPVIAHDIIQTLYQYGKWTDANTDAAATVLSFLGLSLALNGVSLLMSRTFFALQRPWANTGLALGSLAVNIAVSFALYRPLGLAGIVIGTFVGNVVLVGLQIRLLRKETGGALGLLPVLRSLLQVLVASVVAALAASGVALVGRIATDALGVGTPATVVTVLYLGLAILAGGVVYVGLARELGLSELEQAGGRFVRLWARVERLLLRLPGVRQAVAVVRRPVVRSAGRRADAVLSVLALPIGWLARVAEVLSRALVALVPAGPGPATAGAGPGPTAPTPSGPSGPVAPPSQPRGRGRQNAPPVEDAPAAGPDDETLRHRDDRASDASARAVPPADGPWEDDAPSPESRRPRRFGRRAPEPAPEPEPLEDEAPDLYDAAEDWPTIGQRGGETLDVPWPGVERAQDDDPYAEPEWGDDVAPSRLDVYGIELPEGTQRTPEQEARAAQREQAKRLIAAREAALERMAERERRRKAQDERRGRRGRRRD